MERGGKRKRERVRGQKVEDPKNKNLKLETKEIQHFDSFTPNCDGLQPNAKVEKNEKMTFMLCTLREHKAQELCSDMNSSLGHLITYN